MTLQPNTQITPETVDCETCDGSGKIVEAARVHGANQHSACQMNCEDCDGTGRRPAASSPSAVGVGDKERLDWLEKHVVNVRIPLRYGSRDLFWANPDDSFEGEEGPSDIRSRIDEALAAATPGGGK